MWLDEMNTIQTWINGGGDHYQKKNEKSIPFVSPMNQGIGCKGFPTEWYGLRPSVI